MASHWDEDRARYAETPKADGLRLLSLLGVLVLMVAMFCAGRGSL